MTTHTCEGCEKTTPGIRPHANGTNGHAGIPPAGYIIVERCDLCQLYENDLAAATAYGTDPKWQEGFNTAQAICLPPA